MPTTIDLTLRAALAPATFDADENTIEAVISTGADVDRGPFIERLDLAGVDLEAIAGVPVLDAHRQDAASRVIGVVESARHEGDSIVAVIRFTAAEDAAPTITRIKEGTLKGVSIGYRVATWSEGRTDTGKRLRTATAWTVLEVSAVPVAADPLAKFRSTQMEPEVIEYRSQVRAIATRAGLPPEWADERIDGNVEINAVRAQAFEALESRNVQIQTAAPTGGQGADIERRSNAVFARMTGQTPSDDAREFMSESLKDHARAALAARGQSTRGMDDDQLFRAAVTTSDFPNLLTSTANRVLAEAYQAAASPVKAMARQRLHRDFRPMTRIRVGGTPSLEKVAENGEIKSVSRSEAKESFALDTYGSIMSLSRQAMINDDLNAFGDWAQVAGRAAAETEAEILVDLLISNPAMDDGEDLFSTAHGNIAGTGGTIDVDALAAARQAMRLQKGQNGKPINATPAFLLVPPDLETEGEKVLATLNAATLENVNPFAGRLQLAVEPRLPETAWYVFAQPSSLPVLEYAYLSGAPGPQIASREGFDVLGMEFRVVLDFGAGVADFRGAYLNEGE